MGKRTQKKKDKIPENMYQAQVLDEKYFKIFGGVYNDFRKNCRQDYKFELDPLEYNDFIEYFKKGLLSCIILLEDDIPTGFLAYSAALEDAIELYVIHCLGSENIPEKRDCLMEKFLEQTAEKRKQALVSYPMLGVQANYREGIKKFGFKFVDLAVLVFDINDKKVLRDFEKIKFTDLPIGYKITPYRDIYLDELSGVIFEAFKNSSDINFDPRFKTLEGVKDILDKITNSIYGKFLPQCSKILLAENKVAGFAFANITGDYIGNIPLVGIVPEHRGLNLSEVMLKGAVDEIVKLNKSGFIRLQELNVSVDTANESAWKMYKQTGFRESYTYPQAYLAKLTEEPSEETAEDV